ncbi:MAG: response regulator [Verrucomicrobiota bacterium]
MAVDNPTFWLAVEDQEDDFFLLERACLRIQPRPKLHWAQDGLQAKSYLAGEGQFGDRQMFPLPGLILCDVKMPYCNGFELLAWVKQTPHLAEIAFVILTNSNSPADREQANRLGADEFVVKPGAVADLRNVIQEVSERHVG